ncbi:hypothetical protein ACO0QE_000941 [Hanseniaspora vineae]
MPDPQIKKAMNSVNAHRKCKSLLESCQIQIVQILNNNTSTSPAFFCSKIKENIPYHLLPSILRNVNNYEILEKLELQNPGLVFLTEDIWRALLVRDFPNNLHESFTKYKKTIYKKLLDETQLAGFSQSFSLNDEFLDYDESRQMYKIPSKLLYLKYKEELITRENEAKANLINRNKNMQKMNESKSIVFLEKDEDLNAVLGQTVNKYGTNSVKRNGPTKPLRSKLFAKSMNQHKEHYSRIFTDSRKRKRLLELSGGARVPMKKADDGLTDLKNTHGVQNGRDIKKVKVSLGKTPLSDTNQWGNDTIRPSEQQAADLPKHTQLKMTRENGAMTSGTTTSTLTKKKSSFFTNKHDHSMLSSKKISPGRFQTGPNSSSSSNNNNGFKNVYIHDKSQTKRPS